MHQRIDLTGTPPDWPDSATRLWTACAAEALRDSRHTRTPPLAGIAELRAAVGEWSGLDPETLVITAGVRASAALLTSPGDRYVVERPSFSGIPATLRAAGARVELASWSELASVVAAQPLTCSSWITHPCRNPDGANPGPEFRAQLASLREGGHRLVVNEIYQSFTPGGGRIAADHRVGSLSKVAGGGSRIGWLTTAQDAQDVLPSRHVHWPATLTQLTWAAFLRRGGLDLLYEAYVASAVAARLAFVEAAGDVLDPAARVAEGSSLTLRTAGTTALAEIHQRGLLVGHGPDFLDAADRIRLCFTNVSVAAAQAAAELVLAMAHDGLVSSESAGF